MTGLQRRGARYYIRRVIPLDLQEHFGRREIVRSLGTSDPKEAKRLWAVAWADLDKLFDQARGRIAIPEPTTRTGPQTISDAEFDWQMEQLAFQDQQAREDAEAEEAEEAREPRRQQIERRLSDPKADLGDNELAIQDMLNAERFKRQLAEERLAYARAAPAEAIQAKGGHSFAEVIKAWAKEQSPIPRTVRRTTQIVGEFEGLHGKTPVERVTRAQVIAFKDHLLKVGKTAPNVNAYLRMLNVVLNFAVHKMNLMATNPASKIRVAEKVRAKAKRREFDAEALEAIFSSPIYAEGDRPKAASGEAAYWLPLLGLYTGARLNELGQLHPDDVTQEAYRDTKDKDQQAWVIKLVENEERGQELKTEGSERRIPVHADLIKLGFIEYVQAAKAAKLAHIFPDLRPASDGKLTGNWSKWFGRYRRKEIGLTGRDTPFHSFRHSFKHYARLARIPDVDQRELMGHETGDVADTYGGLSYPLAPLVDAMKLYRVPGFQLPAKPARLRP